jgi:nucleotide-binding universal stress UspA family protein
MKTILFPTDFSKNAVHAAQYAGMLARSMNARVVLLNVHAPLISNFKKEEDLRKDIAQSREEAEVDMKKFTTKFIEKSLLCPERIVQCVEYSPSVAQKIVEKAKSINAHFIVMGTKGASNIINKWVGTNAQKVMKTAHCPVWIVPENIEIKFPHKVMYAADLKEDEFLATLSVLQILEPLGVTCKVIHIHDFLSLKSGSKVKELIGSLKQEFKDENVFVRKIDRTDIIEGLESYINLYQPDVLSLAVHEKSVFEKIFETSVTKYFVQNPQLPILTFRK